MQSASLKKINERDDWVSSRSRALSVIVATAVAEEDRSRWKIQVSCFMFWQYFVERLIIEPTPRVSFSVTVFTNATPQFH